MTDPAPAPPPQPARTPGELVDPPPGADYPGKVLGIVGLILVFFTGLIGLILSIVANSQSKAAGYKNTPAKVGIILGIIFIVIGVIVGIIAIILGVAGANALIAQCAELGPGVHEVNGVTITCG